MLFALVILLIAFARDTPPYPLSMDGGTDGGKYRTNSDAGWKGTGIPTTTHFSFTVSASVRRGGRGDRLHPGQAAPGDQARHRFNYSDNCN